ncbi:SLC25A2_15 [Lepeophtheirus salmonis]|uniref:Calmodulin-lysine N-methyltransferase n=1 Tax=Lepeophtheirus salmonis TaxID=72036 RepID=A0A7R8CFB1_LEPSM|nr:SLC25A2_15 [Lepeophtheirus salmonis]CAF2759055.1 SLC25A2_15 [Lepeophtheirus salmonis]
MKSSASAQRWKLLSSSILSTCKSKETLVCEFPNYELIHFDKLYDLSEEESPTEFECASWYRVRLIDFPRISFKIRILNKKTTLRDITGFNNTGNVRLWPSEIILTRYLLENPWLYRKKSVLELGGGMTSLAGICIAHNYGHDKPKSVHCSDGNEESVKNIQKIIEINNISCNKSSLTQQVELTSGCLRWDIEEKGEGDKCYDLIVCSDCLFFKAGRKELAEFIVHKLNPGGGRAIIFAPPRNDTLKEFVQSLQMFSSIKTTLGYSQSEDASIPNLYPNLRICFKETWNKEGVVRGLWCLSKMGSKNSFLAAFWSSFVLCPTELVKCRLQAMREVSSLKGLPPPNVGPFLITKKILKQDGLPGLFRGLTPTFMREMPGYFAFFYAYELSREIMRPIGKTKDEIGPAKTILAGGIAGMTLWSLIFPADVIKSRLQVSGATTPMYQMLITIIRNEGALALYNGLLPTLIRTFPASGFIMENPFCATNEGFSSSALGTKDYWDEFYQLERKNYLSHGDEGEIWFGEDSLNRACQWMEENMPDPNTDILDVGSANGATSIELRLNHGFNNITGEGCSNLKFEVRDLCADTLDPGDSVLRPNHFGAIFDKGTYDAISLCPKDATTLRNNYIKNLSRLLSDEGYLVLTSCNWTESELRDHFKPYFEFEHIIPTVSFQFGENEEERDKNN